MTRQHSDYPLDYTRGPARADFSKTAANTTINRIEDAAVRTPECVEKISEETRQYGDKARDAARNFGPFVRQSMKEQPMATLAVAALIGFAFGALWKK